MPVIRARCFMGSPVGAARSRRAPGVDGRCAVSSVRPTRARCLLSSLAVSVRMLLDVAVSLRSRWLARAASRSGGNWSRIQAASSALAPVVVAAKLDIVERLDVHRQVRLGREVAIVARDQLVDLGEVVASRRAAARRRRSGRSPRAALAWVRQPVRSCRDGGLRQVVDALQPARPGRARRRRPAP